jgi:NADH-quinone oxidoreductase subunit J
MIETIAFFVLATVTLGSAFLVVTLKNIFHAALWLVVSLSGVAALYALLGADFLFVVQLLLYGGGVMVVLLFVVLLSGQPADWVGRPLNHQWLSALLAGGVLAAGVIWAGRHFSSLSTTPPEPTTSNLGQLLMGPLVLPFEVISLVVLVALTGAIFFSQKQHD